MAANQGDHLAQFTLGNRYFLGLGVDQSNTHAFKYYKLSAEQGLTSAQHALGIMYLKGWGVDQSDTLALEWWTKAAKQGDENAIELIKRWEKNEKNKINYMEYSN